MQKSKMDAFMKRSGAANKALEEKSGSKKQEEASNIPNASFQAQSSVKDGTNSTPSGDSSANEKGSSDIASEAQTTVASNPSDGATSKFSRWQARVAASNPKINIGSIEKDPVGDGSRVTTRVEIYAGGPLTPRFEQKTESSDVLKPISSSVPPSASADAPAPMQSPMSSNRQTFGSPYQALDESGSGW